MPTANGHITLNTPVIVRSSVFSLVKKKEKNKVGHAGVWTQDHRISWRALYHWANRDPSGSGLCYAELIPYAWNSARPTIFFQLFLEASNQKKLQHRPPQTNGWKVDLTHHTLISDKIWPRCQKQSHTSEIQLARQIFSLVQASPAGSDLFFGPAFTKPLKFFKIQNDKMPDTQPAWRPSDAVVNRLQDEHAKYYPRSLVQLSPNH